MNSYVKWGFLVAFNTIVSIAIVTELVKTPMDVFGIMSAIACFFLFYAKLDIYLIQQNKKEWHKALIFSTIVTGILSFHPFLPLISGSVAVDATNYIIDAKSFSVKYSGFIPFFLATFFTGLILSSIVLLLTSLSRLVIYLKKKSVRTIADIG